MERKNNMPEGERELRYLIRMQDNIDREERSGYQPISPLRMVGMLSAWIFLGRDYF